MTLFDVRSLGCCSALILAVLAGCTAGKADSDEGTDGSEATEATEGSDSEGTDSEGSDSEGTDSEGTETPANTAPVAEILVPAVAGELVVGDALTFEGACSDADGDGTSGFWNFGGAGQSVQGLDGGTLVFDEVGVFTVSFVCVDDEGLQGGAAVRIVEVFPPDQALTGRLTYDRIPSTLEGLDYDAVSAMPIRGVELVAIDPDDPETALAWGVSDDDGQYTLEWKGPHEVIVVVYTTTVDPVIAVRDNTADGAIYGLVTEVLDLHESSTVDLHAESGWDGEGFVHRTAAPFAVLDSAWQAARAFLDERPDIVFDDLTLFWSENNAPVAAQTGESSEEAYAAGHIGTSHWNGTALYILGEADVDVDEFDDHVIFHEWGHYFEDTQSRSDSPGGPHSPGDIKDPRLAFGEGWGNALSGILGYPNTVYSDVSGPGQGAGFGFDLEDSVDTDYEVPGWYSETSVQAALFDLFDDSGDDEAFDEVALGLGPIYDLMVGPQRETPAMTTLFSFVDAAKTAHPGDADAIDTLMLDEGAFGVPVADAWGTGETLDGGVPGSLPVYGSFSLGGVASVTMSAGELNSLGANRYIRLVGDGLEGYVHAEVSDGQDVDIEVYREGELVVSGYHIGDTESTDAFVAELGVDYVIVVIGYGDAESYTADLYLY